MNRLLVVAGIFGVLVLAGLGYWTAIGKAERWLLFNESIAETYANVLLRGDIAPSPDELIDVQVSTHPGWVIFSSHADDHGVVLAYAPGRRPDPLTADAAVSHWRQLNERWYELVQR